MRVNEKSEVDIVGLRLSLPPELTLNANAFVTQMPEAIPGRARYLARSVSPG